ncbi:diacylglycerol lipase-beta-like [Lineus longissimus]|uniref:diacylglycerol lipase-beta-like n=1 Tax=Lineus longissimus TaxID=88925 RepID=UPI002B4C5BC5
MPGLILFNRRWHVGDDDFVFRGIMEMVFRAAWLIALAVVYGVHNGSFTCKAGLYLEIFFIGLIGQTVIHIILTLGIVCVSSQGTMVDAYPRRWLRITLYLKFVFGFVPECILLIAGTYWAFGNTATCDDEVLLTMRIAALMGLVVILLFIISIAVLFDPLGGKMRSEENTDVTQVSTDVWLQRCSRICCCVGTGNSSKASLSTIARIAADFFAGIDLVATDIAAGFVLVHQDQHRRGLDEGYIISPSDETVEGAVGPEATPGSPSPPIEDWLDINRMIRYLKYAQAAFGWPFYLVMNGNCSGPCTLAKHYKCCAPEDDSVVEDNCCQCNLAALKLTVEIPECDIIYATYHDSLFQVPFYVAYNHKDKTVMLVSRGLMSLKDTVTSLTVQSEPIEFSELPDEPNEAHSGIMKTARYIKCKSEEYLQEAFQEHPDYTLVLTGYSLGAGLSACLALLYHSQYPTLKCYSFAGPPVLTPALAQYAQAFICSVVFAKDMIPRMSRVNMDDLKLKVLRQIKHSKSPKFRILASGVWRALCCCRKPAEEVYNPDHTTTENEIKLSEQHDSKVNLAEEDSESWVDKAIASCQKDVGAYPVLNVPGKIMRIIEVENNEYRYLLWTKHDDLREIIVTPRMLTDHLPTRMLAAFEFLARTGQTPLDHLPQQHIQNNH